MKRGRERERESEIVRGTIFGRREKITSPFLKAPSQCPFGLQVKIMHKFGF
jgi:hypothetical protein